MTDKKVQLLLSAQKEALIVNSDEIVTDNIFYKYKLSKKIDKTIKLLNLKYYKRENFDKEIYFQKRKYHEYLSILTKRLNHTHKVNKSELYWERIIGLYLLMHLHHTRYIFQIFENNNIKDNVYINLLNDKCYQTPDTTEDYRNIIQYSYAGYEQLLSKYFQVFGNEHNYKISYYKKNFEQKVSYRTPDVNFLNRLASKDLNEVFFSSTLRIARLIFSKLVNPRLLLVETIFTPKNYLILLLKSLGKIQILNEFNLPSFNSKKNIFKRKKLLSLNEKNCSRYDKFFFQTMIELMPKSWLENFNIRRNHIINLLDNYKNLHSVVSETSLETTQLLISEAKEREIAFLCNEHNWLQHHLSGNKIWFHIKQCDYYLSLGWGNGNSNIIPSGSLFRWKFSQLKKKKINILFVSSLCMGKMTHLDTHGESGSDNIRSYLKMNKMFFSSLNLDILGKIYFRSHPHSTSPYYVENSLDDKIVFKDFINNFQYIDNRRSIKAEKLMRNSEIIIVNYFSTGWLQALFSGTPVIVLWNSSAYRLNKNYKNFFEELEKVHIVHRDPKNAAKFLTKIIKDPLIWWNSSKTQKAVKNFLGKNFIHEKNLKNLLIKSSRSNKFYFEKEKYNGKES